tara:strand:- start:404 stop:625 length:222 start_codon:yes stop_codon:yes gene_type:complete
MKGYKEFLEEQSKDSLATYIANNLYRIGNRKNANQVSILMLIAASVLSNKDDVQSVAAARRLVQLAISKQQKT